MCSQVNEQVNDAFLALKEFDLKLAKKVEKIKDFNNPLELE